MRSPAVRQAPSRTASALTVPKTTSATAITAKICASPPPSQRTATKPPPPAIARRAKPARSGQREPARALRGEVEREPEPEEAVERPDDREIARARREHLGIAC